LFALEFFGGNWNSKYPLIAKSWHANWQHLSPMFSLPKEVRRAVYTTESLNRSITVCGKLQKLVLLFLMKKLL